MQAKGYLLSGGYGNLKGQTFRLAHMGDLRMADIGDVLQVMDEVIAAL
jgi:aspartate aminotransferase-like enzyme